jgi:hypothetical protein
MTGTPEPNGAGPTPPGWVRVEVHPGSGVVDRHDDAVLVLPSVAPAQRDRAVELLSLHQRGPDPTGRRRIRYAAWLLTDAEPEEVVPPFALLVRVGGTLLVLVHGDVTVSVDGPDPLTLNAAGSLTWLERRVEAPYDVVVVTGPGEAAGHAAAAVPFDLREGTVPGGGVTLRATAHPTGTPAARQAPEPTAAPTPARPPEPIAARTPEPTPERTPEASPEPIHQAAARAAAPGPEPPRESVTPRARERLPVEAVTTSQTVLRSAAPFRSVRLGERRRQDPTSGRRPPLPVGTALSVTPAPPRPGEVEMVEGVSCRNAHFNDPESATCASCGVPLEGSAGRHREPRPPLGVLVTDDGSVFTVNGDYVIGRDPARAAAVLTGQARPLVLQDEEHSTSRVHARLTLSGWKVMVSDGGSANGTFVSRSGPAGPWTPVPADPGARLYPGDRVRIGKRQLLFDCYHEPLRP